jgi:hypothetical protein
LQIEDYGLQVVRASLAQVCASEPLGSNHSVIRDRIRLFEMAGQMRQIRNNGLVAAVVFAAALLITLGAGLASSGEVARAAPPKPVTLKGVVRNAAGPVAGAVVRVAVTDNKTTSGKDGGFVLRQVDASAAFTVTAWLAGHYVGWASLKPDSPEITAGRPVSITLKAHYVGDNPQYTWFSFNGVEGSASCAICHTQNPEWEADAHSQAAVNPRFLSMYSGNHVDGREGQMTRFSSDGKALPPDPATDFGPGYKLDNPSRAGNCAACHTPLASKISNAQNCGWSGCHTSLTAERSPNGVVPPAPSPLNLTGDAAEGITCDFCHKIGDVYLDKAKMPLPDMPGILSYRLYRPAEGDQLFFGTFDDIPRRDTYLPLLEQSEYCAPCHYGVFGGVVGVGHVGGGVEIYNSYGEWLNSAWSDPDTGKTCQECHMPVADYDYFVFPEKGGQPRPGQLHVHKMPGAADETLLQNSVTLTATAALKGNQIVVDVSITNDQTGHHIPTDAPIRSMMLVVTARDDAGKLLALQEGPALPGWTGDYAGQPGRAYAKILRDDWTGETPTGAYWRPVTIVEDTRLAAFQTDRSRYTFTLPASQAGANVEARLVFRRAFAKLAEQKGWTDPDILMERETIKLSRSK